GLTISPNGGPATTQQIFNVQSGASVTGTGVLTIAPTQTAQRGSLNVSGSGSVATFATAPSASVGTSAAGAAGTGTINVSDNGVFHAPSGMTTFNATGKLAINGGNYYSHGDLVLNGGRLTRDSSGLLAFDSGHAMTLQSAGQAVLTGNYSLPVSGSLTVSGGGSSFTATSCLLASGNSRVVVNGGGSLTADCLQLGTGGVTNANGSVTLTDVNSAASFSTIEIGAAKGSSGSLNVGAGATLTVNSSVTLNNTASFNINAGGVLTGAAIFAGTATVNIAGSYLPTGPSGASSTAAINFAPDVAFQSTTSVTMNIGGKTAGPGYDQLLFNGAGITQVQWGGTLNVRLTNSFVPQAGDTFQLFSFDPERALGVFTNVSFPSLPPGLFWRADQLYVSGIIRVSRVPDTFAEWQTHYFAGDFSADDDHDGVPNGIEFLLGTDPESASTSSPLQAVYIARAGNLRAGVTFQMPADPSDGAHYRVQASPDLSNWTTIASQDGRAFWTGSAEVSVGPTNSGFVTVTVSELLPETTTRRFYRLAAVAPQQGE
ncbi:MAG: autotransporter adhesin family protein, partial [Acidobacteriota bacterium]|nr:autotransporter adhesin family protein [Acidobacteriota bacterium]